MRVAELAERVANGDRRACARLITLVESRDPEALAALASFGSGPGVSSLRVGVTGSPGAGKSTLVDHLVHAARSEHAKVGVLAVDPSSPFSGGAILGDRVRMQGHAGDPGVFIRSMGSRGHTGGLAAAAAGAARVLEAFGCSVVILETVGVGQSEIEVASLADVTVLVLSPNAGDGIQAMKAGIMEVPDLFVVNKADIPGADAALKEIRAMLAESRPALVDPAGADPAVVRDRALATRSLAAFEESGVPELWRAIAARRPAVASGPRKASRTALISEALAIVAERLNALTGPGASPHGSLRPEPAYKGLDAGFNQASTSGQGAVVPELFSSEAELHVAAQRLLERVFGNHSPSLETDS